MCFCTGVFKGEYGAFNALKYEILIHIMEKSLVRFIVFKGGCGILINIMEKSLVPWGCLFAPVFRNCVGLEAAKVSSVRTECKFLDDAYCKPCILFW